MRPPIREISANQFVSSDQSWRRAYSGTPLPMRENRFLWGHIAMRPPIREISANRFVSGDQSWRRAYSGTPLPDLFIDTEKTRSCIPRGD